MENFCTFRYERIWLSLDGKDVEAELKKAFFRAQVVRLRRHSHLTKEQQKDVHDAFWQAGEQSLYKAILNSSGSQVPPKLFAAVSLPLGFGWWIEKLTVLQSSMAAAGHREPTDELTGLLRILHVSELRTMILDNLGPNMDDIDALSSTCKLAAGLVKESTVCSPSPPSQHRFVIAKADMMLPIGPLGL